MNKLATETQPATKHTTWTRTDTNFWLDVILGLVFSAYAGISVIVRFVFPRATNSIGWHLWGLNLDDWMQIQFVTLGVFAFLILLHVMLHWTWVCNVFMQRVRKKNQKPDDGIQTITGVGAMIVLLNIVGALVAAAALTIQAPK
jgi:hypothetical protein